jgi:hypothetical protein
MTKILTIPVTPYGVEYSPPLEVKMLRDDLVPHQPVGTFPLDARPIDCNQIYRTMTYAEEVELYRDVERMNDPETVQDIVDKTEMIIGVEHIATGAVRWNGLCQCDLPPGTVIYTKGLPATPATTPPEEDPPVRMLEL